jgi:hypothetical protein
MTADAIPLIILMFWFGTVLATGEGRDRAFLSNEET